jgi:hypothetical protein
MDYSRLSTAGVIGGLAAIAVGAATGGLALIPLAIGGAAVGAGVDTAFQSAEAGDQGQEFSPLPETVTNPLGATPSALIGLALAAGAIYFAYRIITKNRL